jgi:hypothetical protein
LLSCSQASLWSGLPAVRPGATPMQLAMAVTQAADFAGALQLDGTADVLQARRRLFDASWAALFQGGVA